MVTKESENPNHSNMDFKVTGRGGSLTSIV